MANGGTSFATGLFEGMTGLGAGLTAKWEREKKLKFMQQYMEAIQKYQTEGTPIDPQMAAQAAMYGMQPPTTALKGFDPSVLEGAGAGPQAAPRDPSGRIAPRAVPTAGAPRGAGPAGAPGVLTESELFQAGVKGFPEAAEATQSQRIAEMNRQGLAPQIVKYSHLAGYEFPDGETFEGYIGMLRANGLKEYADWLMKERSKGPDPAKGPGKIKDKILASSAWQVIRDMAKRGASYNEYEPEQREMIAIVFPDENDREWFLGYQGDIGRAIKTGGDILDEIMRPLFPNVYLKGIQIAGWSAGDKEMLKEMSGLQVKILERYFNEDTGEPDIRKIVELGQGMLGRAEEVIKASNMPKPVQDYIAGPGGLVESQLANPGMTFTRQIIERDMKARNIEYNIEEVMLQFYKALIEARKNAN